MKKFFGFKFLLFMFIVYAVYVGHKQFFKDIPGKVVDFFPSAEVDKDKTKKPDDKKVESTDETDLTIPSLKFNPTDESSMMEKGVSSVLNKILEHPKGRDIMKELLQKMMRQSSEITEHDLFMSRFLAYDSSVGSGKEVVCGDMIEILYKIVDKGAKDSHLPKDEERLRTALTIGDGIMGLGLENGIIGMKEGGRRVIIYPKATVYDQLGHMKLEKEHGKHKSLIAEVELKSIKSSCANKRLGRPFFSKLDFKDANSIKLMCGDKVEGYYSLRKLDGSIVYDSKKKGNKLVFKVGEKNISGVSNAIIGLPLKKADVSFINKGSVIRDVFSHRKDFSLDNVALKDSEYVLLDFELGLQGNEAKVRQQVESLKGEKNIGK